MPSEARPQFWVSDFEKNCRSNQHCPLTYVVNRYILKKRQEEERIILDFKATLTGQLAVQTPSELALEINDELFGIGKLLTSLEIPGKS